MVSIKKRLTYAKVNLSRGIFAIGIKLGNFAIKRTNFYLKICDKANKVLTDYVASLKKPTEK